MKAYYIIGIGGVGMSALAHILLSKKMSVNGSDVKTSKICDELKEKGAVISFIQQPSNIKKDQIVVYSTAIKEDHPEFAQAKLLGCKMLHRSELLKQLLSEKKELVVVGSHGKTTTTSLLAHVLTQAQMHPSYAIGGFSDSLDQNGCYGSGEYFACEGDESDGSFLKTNPFGVIVNNIDADHIGYHWNSYEELLQAFKTYITMIPDKKLLIYNGDDETLQKWRIEGVSFGFSKQVEVRAENVVFDGFGMKFDIVDGAKRISDVKLALIGHHNTLNALGVYALASRVGVSDEDIKSAFANFKGVKRRLELKANIHNIFVIDDYAHHPKEIKETVDALTQAFPVRRIIKVFQPHRYTRVTDLLKEFVSALEQISENLIVTDIFAAGESPKGLVSTESFLDALESTTEFQYVPREGITDYLNKIVEPGDIVLIMGAGDITKEADSFAEEMKHCLIDC